MPSGLVAPVLKGTRLHRTSHFVFAFYMLAPCPL